MNPGRGHVPAAAPKYALIERERRWLVEPSRCPLPEAFVLIEDRYISGTRLRLRRMTGSATGTIVLKLSKKYEAADPAARPIVTAYLTAAEFAVLGALSAAVLVKRRYAVDGFSVDVFLEPQGLPMIAEIECGDAEALRAAMAPAWALAEITDDPDLVGAVLAGRRE